MPPHANDHDDTMAPTTGAPRWLDARRAAELSAMVGAARAAGQPVLMETTDYPLSGPNVPLGDSIAAAAEGAPVFLETADTTVADGECPQCAHCPARTVSAEPHTAGWPRIVEHVVEGSAPSNLPAKHALTSSAMAHVSAADRDTLESVFPMAAPRPTNPIPGDKVTFATVFPLGGLFFQAQPAGGQPVPIAPGVWRNATGKTKGAYGYFDTVLSYSTGSKSVHNVARSVEDGCCYDVHLRMDYVLQHITLLGYWYRFDEVYFEFEDDNKWAMAAASLAIVSGTLAAFPAPGSRLAAGGAVVLSGIAWLISEVKGKTTKRTQNVWMRGPLLRKDRIWTVTTAVDMLITGNIDPAKVRPCKPDEHHIDIVWTDKSKGVWKLAKTYPKAYAFLESTTWYVPKADVEAKRHKQSFISSGAPPAAQPGIVPRPEIVPPERAHKRLPGREAERRTEPPR